MSYGEFWLWCVLVAVVLTAILFGITWRGR